MSDNRGFCDIHCHILPGLDDGPNSIDESIVMCRQAVEENIRTIVATPHYNDVYMPSPDAVQEKADKLRTAIANEGLPLEILIGADVAAGPHLRNIAKAKKYLTINGQAKYMLLEPPHRAMPDWINDVIFELRSEGLEIILTHPERNYDVQQQPNILLPLVQSGVMVQVTADSITGDFGREAQKCAASLLRMQAVHFIATDAHSSGHRSPRLWDAMHRAARYDQARVLDMVDENPHSIIAGRHIEIPDPQPAVSWLKRLTISG